MSNENHERQGGDLRGRSQVRLDLSTCVNPYGPPDAVLHALRNVPAEVVRAHPYEAAADVELAYAEFFGRPAGEFVAGQGASELIWTLARHFHGKTAGIPLPAYTEFRQAFPDARRFGGGPATHPHEILDHAMRACDVVIVSNPHNPTGQVMQRDSLAEAARRHPDCLLVVDESYMDFMPDQDAVTLAGCDAGNVIVLRSPSKFFGLAGVRSGVAWSVHPQRAQWRQGRTNWPVSALAATALRSAMASGAWTTAARRALATDTAWLERLLTRTGLAITPGQLHFRLLTGSTTEVAGFASSLTARGIIVRVLEDSCGVGEPAIRISAPRLQDRDLLASALARHAGED